MVIVYYSCAFIGLIFVLFVFPFPKTETVHYFGFVDIYLHHEELRSNVGKLKVEVEFIGGKIGLV